MASGYVHGQRVAVITGASNGNGQAYAKRLAEDGFDIAIADIRDASETERLVKDAGREVVSRLCDVTSEDDLEQFRNAVAERMGRCDVLINNAGIYPYTGIEEMTFAEWRKVLSVDLDGPFLVTKAFLPQMKSQGKGRIINVASSECWMAAKLNTHYIAAKMGVVGFTRGLATEVADFGITANAIAPGITRTHTVEQTAPQYLETLPKGQAIHRPAEPVDLARVVSFLASDDSGFMTGQTVVVDGGWVRL